MHIVEADDAHSDMRRERLHWALDVAGGTYDVEILPGLIGSVGIDLDGHHVASIPKPARQHPWQEASFPCAGEAVVVTLTWAFPVMRTDVFVDGHSVVDGRSLEMARAAAPAPVRGYDLWMDPGFRLGIDNPRLMPPGVVGGLVAALLVLAALALAGSSASGPVGGVVVLIALCVPAGVWFYWWLVVTVRTNRYLLAHRELGDARRVAAFWTVFLGWPIVWLGLAAAVVAFASR